jgi:hypothetical protein
MTCNNHFWSYKAFLEGCLFYLTIMPVLALSLKESPPAHAQEGFNRVVSSG